MFQANISFPFSRLFRFRRRGAAKASTNNTQASFSAPPPSQSRRPVSLKPQTINTAHTASTQRPRTTFISPGLSPIAQSPPPSSHVALHADPLPPIVIIEREVLQSPLPLPPPPTPPGDVGPQNALNGILLRESPPARKTRCVSFQLPTTDTESPPATPLSTCSTLVAEGEAEAEPTPAVPPDQPPAFETLYPGFVGVAPATELPGVVRSGSRAARTKSFVTAQPVRVDVSRFSLPVKHAVPVVTASTNTRDSRRQSRRTSLMPPVSSSSLTKKEKRTTRWSTELNKPESQEVLKVLRGL